MASSNHEAQPSRHSEFLDSLSETIDDTPEPSPVVLDKQKTKRPSEALFNNAAREMSCHSKIVCSHGPVDDGEINSDDDVPIITLNKTPKTNVVSSDSIANFLTDDENEPFGEGRVVSSGDEEYSRDVAQSMEESLMLYNRGTGSDQSNETTQSYKTASENITRKTTSISSTISSNGATPSFKTAAVSLTSNDATTSPSFSFREARDSLAWSNSSGELYDYSKIKNTVVVKAELVAAKQKVVTLSRATSTAAMSPSELMLRLDEAEKEMVRKEEQVRMLDGEEGSSTSTIMKEQQGSSSLTNQVYRGASSLLSQAWLGASSFINQAWQAQRKDLHGFGISENERAKMLAEFGANNIYDGRMDQIRKREVRSVTMEALEAMHTSLETMPSEGNEEDQPSGLRDSIHLFPYQKQALAWLLWRETQHPAGGILADDMGLGKTLTMISLLLKHRELEAEREMVRRDQVLEEKQNTEWNEKGNELVTSKTTLIVCPASLLGQWEKEVESKVTSGLLRLLVYHGRKRKCSSRKLAQFDIIITTYGTVQVEVKSELGDKADKDVKTKMDDLVAAEDLSSTKGCSELLDIAWERIILDEAHHIRNPKSLTSQAVCRLRAERRWCLTGTPIQNKELDMYALVRFIRCSPFDEYRVWKAWIDNKGPSGQERLNTLVRSLLLRRTKETKSHMTGKCIVDLPEKLQIEHKIELTPEEREVYMEVFSFAQESLKRFMNQKEERQEMNELIFSGSRETGAKSSGENFSYMSGASSEMEYPENVKVHHILVLLLRLRQICCHPGLIKSMLDTEAKAAEGLQDDDGVELDLISAMEDMSVIGVGKTNREYKILNLSNPVFDTNHFSSKINTVIKELTNLKRKQDETGIIEKIVIVSQWTTMLNMIRGHVETIGMLCLEINGKVAVKLRGGIVKEFNTNPRGPEVMLLSLAAGGVGLNLVGANHLFLLDIHWNPQLEAQACDRVYRVGQKREVKIHRFLVEDTIEERILLLQEAKLNLAHDVLTGAKRIGANKLTMDDLKMLFQVV